MRRTMMVYVGGWLCPPVRRPRVSKTNQLTLLAALPEGIERGDLTDAAFVKRPRIAAAQLLTMADRVRRSVGSDRRCWLESAHRQANGTSVRLAMRISTREIAWIISVGRAG